MAKSDRNPTFQNGTAQFVTATYKIYILQRVINCLKNRQRALKPHFACKTDSGGRVFNKLIHRFGG
jgi:hypothetical protein